MSENQTTLTKQVWNLANVLRDDGVSYLDYLEQITYILFLKMADEYTKAPYFKKLNLPNGDTWDDLKGSSGSELDKKYNKILEDLGKKSGILGEIYSNATNKIKNPSNLKKVINLIDKQKWTSMSSDVKGDIYEGLLQKGAEDTKSGAGQYFTPRALINTIVKCVRPLPEKTICDPACGTGGFLLSAHAYISNPKNYQLTKDQKQFLKFDTFYGWELVDTTYRLCLMNLFLHNINDIDQDGNHPLLITRRDSLLSKPSVSFDYVLTNPPFGRKSSYTVTNDEGEEEKEDATYERQDFRTTTSNKQLNFVQHIWSILKQNGKCAVVLPDNVLFEDGAGDVIRRNILQKTNLHTILRLPTGIFYKPGVKANVLFFDNKPASEEWQTKEVWVYDFRTNEHFTLKQNPLTESSLDDFVKCYNPDDITKRQETYSEENPNGRFRKFTIKQIEENGFKLDLKWIKEDDGSENLSLSELLEALTEKSKSISNAVKELNELLKGIEE